LERYEFLLQLNSANLSTYESIFRVRGINLPRRNAAPLSTED